RFRSFGEARRSRLSAGRARVSFGPAFPRAASFVRPVLGKVRDRSGPTRSRAHLSLRKRAKEWCDALATLARKAYVALDGVGYGRVDIRRDERTGEFLV